MLFRSTVAAFAKAALAWAADKKISGTKETATGGTVTFSNLDLGYYLVDSSLGALCGLNTTNPDATIKEKNEKPEIKKEVQTSAGDWSSENNAKIGDTVEYKVEIKVADGAQKYTVTDTMSKGLTFNNSSLKVTANDAVTTDYTLTSTTNGFTLVLPETYVSTLTKGTTIIVTYNATLNKDAVIDGDGNANEVKLSYGNHQNTVPSKLTTKSYQFDLVKDIQVLCPTKLGPTGTQALNAELQAMLNPPRKGKPELQSAARVFRVGDKVMQVRNNYEITWQRIGGEQGVGAYNGDIGIVESIDVRSRSMVVRMDDRRLVYPAENLNELEIAYAITVHKSQGSEFPAVILPAAQVPPRLCYRNLFYTGVTRGRKLCIVVGRRDVVNRMMSNIRQNLRYSGLAALLAEALPPERENL